MSEGSGELVGFAYGEDLESLSQRSLGYRLLVPLEPEPWCDEVEALARRLQAAPYSDHWPSTSLFCSVLLADGRRVVALARYGLSDHTPSQRRGGLELVGVIAPPGLDVASALALYRWLEKRRDEVEDLHRLGGVYRLEQVLATVPAQVAPSEPVPVLPVRLWQDGALLFAASTPSDPDHHLRLLEQAAGNAWQWLPLVGSDFPLRTHAQRGPLVAWTPHLAGVALKLDRKQEPAPTSRPPRSRFARAVAVLLLLSFVGLLGVNAWLLHSVRKQLAVQPAAAPAPAEGGRGKVPAAGHEEERERLVAALHQLVFEGGGAQEWEGRRAQLLALYRRLVHRHPRLALPSSDEQGQLTIAAIHVLAERSPGHIEDSVRQALEGKGFSDKVIRAACEHVHEQLQAEIKEQR